MHSLGSQLFGVQAAEVERVWGIVSPDIERALRFADGKYQIEDVKDALSRRDMQLWVAAEGGEALSVAVTEIVNYPRKRVCVVMFCGGREFKRWLHHIEEIERWAKGAGCDMVEICGRRGWRRVLPRYNSKLEVLAREI